MPSWPTTPTPYSVSPFGLLDPVIRFEVDQGYSVRRSRWSRGRRLYQVTYLEPSDTLLPLTDFIERVIRGGALSFDWTYPYPSTLFSIVNSTPNAVTMTAAHGLQTGDQVVITGTASHNNTYTITRTGATTYTLDGTAGGTSEGAVGSAALVLPYAALVLENETLAPPDFQHDFGPLQDTNGLFRLALHIREEFG
jgi:hypothetical protein